MAAFLSLDLRDFKSRRRISWASKREHMTILFRKRVRVETEKGSLDYFDLKLRRHPDYCGQKGTANHRKKTGHDMVMVIYTYKCHP